MILLIDHNLPPLLAQIMHPLADQGGHCVEHVRHRYGDGVADVDWMAQLAEERDSAFLTLDVSIRKRAPEIEAFRRSGLVGFWLRSKTWKRRLERDRFHELAGRLILRWPDIVTTTQLTRGQAFEIPASGARLQGLRL